jgi:hypothetical protein
MIASDVFQRALEHWQAVSVSLLPPASDAEIATAFGAVEFPLSDDVRSLYRLTAGFDDGQFDGGLWSLWPLSRIVEENKKHKPQFLWFADWLIDSHRYCFRYTNPEVSAVYIDHCARERTPFLIAESLVDFLDKYLRNPDAPDVFEQLKLEPPS